MILLEKRNIFFYLMITFLTPVLHKAYSNQNDNKVIELMSPREEFAACYSGENELVAMKNISDVETGPWFFAVGKDLIHERPVWKEINEKLFLSFSINVKGGGDFSQQTHFHLFRRSTYKSSSRR